jgi:GrpB-like predicted nucleotidyltransferase (UPF0157 family)
MELGLRRGTVALQPHDPAWETAAEACVEKLKSILGSAARDVQHVGSTAVRSIAAKPILDLVVGVERLDQILAFREALEENGFIFRGQDRPGQYLFVRGGENMRTHHVHVAEYGSEAWENYINLRDYLNSHEEDAAAYQKLKEELARKYPDDRSAYTAGKAGMIGELLKKARIFKKTRYFADRSEWRDWLSAHFETESEVWFVFPSKASGETGVSYNDAVEEALCFGWIDGRAGTLDETHQLRRFTPRRKGSAYSQPNIERLIWLEERSMIHPKIRESVLPVIEAPFNFPADIISALKEDGEVWKNYKQFTEPYKRIRVAYIEAARKRPEEFEKRLRSFIDKTRRVKLIRGYGGVEKYYR